MLYAIAKLRGMRINVFDRNTHSVYSFAEGLNRDVHVRLSPGGQHMDPIVPRQNFVPASMPGPVNVAPKESVVPVVPIDEPKKPLYGEVDAEDMYDWAITLMLECWGHGNKEGPVMSPIQVVKMVLPEQHPEARFRLIAGVKHCCSSDSCKKNSEICFNAIPEPYPCLPVIHASMHRDHVLIRENKCENTCENGAPPPRLSHLFELDYHYEVESEPVP